MTPTGLQHLRIERNRGGSVKGDVAVLEVDADAVARRELVLERQDLHMGAGGLAVLYRCLDDVC